MKKITNLLLFGLLFTTLVAVSVSQASAVPSPGLRVIVIDVEAGGFSGSLVFSTNTNLPSNNAIPINNEGTLDFGENIATFDGDVYVANVDRISRLNLDANGVPVPPLDTGDNVEDITGGDFSSLTGIVIDGNGLAYVSDSSDNEIYTVDLTATPLVSRSLLAIDHDFVFIRDIALENNKLFVLDADLAGDNGRIFSIDLGATPSVDGLPAVQIYSGDDIGSFSLSDTHNIAVNNGIVYVSGNFAFGSGIISIDSNLLVPVATIFSNNSGGQLSTPNGLVIDTVGNDLYVADDNTDGNDVPTIYRFSLSDPVPASPTFVTDELLETPAGLALLTVEESTLTTILTATKEVDNPTPLPLEHIIYTITVTNEGPDAANTLFVRDDFPDTVPPGIVTPFAPDDQLSYTSTIRDGITGDLTPGGTCTLTATHTVECQGFGSLDKDDSVIITIEGIVEPGAQGSIINEVTAINEIFSATASVDITVTPSVVFSTLTKTASFIPPVVAGDSTIDYEIIIDNSNPSGTNAQNVVVTDLLPNGVTIDQGTIPSECQAIENLNGSSQLECSYPFINNGNGRTIQYTISVDSDAPDPLVNTVTVVCDNCEPGQSATTETEVLRQSELSIEKTADKTEVIAGQDSILYTISIANAGPSDAANVIITDNLPTGVTFSTTGSPPECSADLQNNVVTCNISSIPAGTTQNFDINVNVNSSAVGPLENAASVTSDSTETNLNDNEASADPIVVLQFADVVVTKTGPPKTVAGRIITYNFTVANIGSSDAANVVLTDELPAGFIFIPSTDPGSLTDPMCQDQLGTAICEFGTIGAGQTQTKLIQTKIDLTVAGDIKNTANVITDTEESNFDNNLSSIVTIVEPPFCGRAEADFDEVITGTSGNDHIKGTNGDDLIFGLGGNDKIHGKNGNDCLLGGDGNDKLWGGKGDDGIEGNAGNDRIHGQQGNDTLLGDDGDDKIWGGQGNDTIDAGTGNDKVHANQGDDIVNGGDGNDWLGAGIGNDIVNAGSGNDKIFGRPGNDNLFGEDGNDIIHGGQGDDLLNGGPNDDQCHGGPGTNTFVDCESQKQMKEEEDEEEEDEDDDEKKGKKDKGKKD